MGVPQGHKLPPALFWAVFAPPLQKVASYCQKVQKKKQGINKDILGKKLNRYEKKKRDNDEKK